MSTEETAVRVDDPASRRRAHVLCKHNMSVPGMETLRHGRLAPEAQGLTVGASPLAPSRFIGGLSRRRAMRGRIPAGIHAGIQGGG